MAERFRHWADPRDREAACGLAMRAEEEVLTTAVGTDITCPFCRAEYDRAHRG